LEEYWAQSASVKIDVGPVGQPSDMHEQEHDGNEPDENETDGGG